MGAREVIAADGLDDVTSFLLELAAGDEDAPASARPAEPQADGHLLARAAAARELVALGQLHPLDALELVCWPCAELEEATNHAVVPLELPIGSRQKWLPAEIAQLAALDAQGLSAHEIAARVGTTSRHVRRLLLRPSSATRHGHAA